MATKEGRSLIFILIIVLMSGCARIIIPTAVGGSRADATVDFSYEHGSLVNPQIDWNDVLQSAKDKCRAWGYTGADPFGGKRTSCAFANQQGCLRYTVTVTYQCTRPEGGQP
ncbi:MAG: YecR family lipoprotein [Permianibacter sp.]